MTATATPCPSPDDLRRLTIGQLDPSQSDSLVEHIGQCTACRGELETIEDGEDSFIAALRHQPPADDFANEPDCQNARIKALGALESLGALANQAAASDAVASCDVPPPQRIGEYEIVRPLGRGGMGSVFLARHTKLGREVAVKLLASHRLADPRMKQRFEAEMRAVGRLSHPNVVTAHDAREVDGTAVLVTEYIDGLDLGQLLRRTGPLNVADACEIARQVAVALAYTSGQAFVHRDVKPSNVMLSRQGEVKLLDLGLARFLQAEGSTEMTAGGQAMGTADYIAPEQVTDSRSVDVRADIYSLGCTLFRLLTGSAPFADETHGTVFAKMTAHVSQRPPRLAERIPGGGANGSLVKLVDSMLAKQPSRRPQTAQEVADRLQPHAVGADLPRLAELARGLEPDVGLEPAGTPSAAPDRLLRKPQTAGKPRRMVPLSLAVAAGLGGMVLGLVLGLIITIKTPSGETISLNVPDGSSVEIAAAAGTPAPDGPAAVNDGVVPELRNGHVPSAGRPALVLEGVVQEPWRQGAPFPVWEAIEEQPSADSSAEEIPGPRTPLSFAVLLDSDEIDLGDPESIPKEAQAAFEAAGGVAGTIFETQHGRWYPIADGVHAPRTSVHGGTTYALASNLISNIPPGDLASRIDSVAISPRNKRYFFALSEALSGWMFEVTSNNPHQWLAFILDGKIVFTSEIRSPIRREMTLHGMTLSGEQNRFLLKSIRPDWRRAQAFSASPASPSTRDVPTIQPRLLGGTAINLKRIGLGFHKFYDQHRLLPSSNTRGVGAGPAYAHDQIKPFSWRVALLPYIGEQGLYDEYRFDEPWDSEHNLTLLPRMPLTYRSPFTSLADAQANPGHTHYLGFVGEQTALGDENTGQVSLQSITDGTSNTLLVIESETSVPWTKPEDIPYSGPEDLEKIALPADRPIPLLMADAATRLMQPLDRELLGKLITRNGGEPVDLEVLHAAVPDAAFSGASLR